MYCMIIFGIIVQVSGVTPPCPMLPSFTVQYCNLFSVDTKVSMEKLKFMVKNEKREGKLNFLKYIFRRSVKYFRSLIQCDHSARYNMAEVSFVNE